MVIVSLGLRRGDISSTSSTSSISTERRRKGTFALAAIPFALATVPFVLATVPFTLATVPFVLASAPFVLAVELTGKVFALAVETLVRAATVLALTLAVTVPLALADEAFVLVFKAFVLAPGAVVLASRATEFAAPPLKLDAESVVLALGVSGLARSFFEGFAGSGGGDSAARRFSVGILGLLLTRIVDIVQCCCIV